MPHKLTAALAFAVALAGLGPASLSGKDAPKFHTPADDLWSVDYRDTRVIFMMDGSFVVRRGRRYLMDGGLSFGADGWKVQGQQQRWGYPTGKRSASKDGSRITFHGTVGEEIDVKSLAYVQAVTATAQTLQFRYDVTVLRPMTLEQLGAVFHLPIRHYLDEELRCDPSGVRAFFPVTQPKVNKVLSAAGTRTAVAQGTGLELGIETRQPVDWNSYDERAWNLNTYSLWLCPKVAKAQAKAGDRFAIEFGLAVSATAAARVGRREAKPVFGFPETPDAPRVWDAAKDSSGKAMLVRLPDDEDTRGDWRQFYGKYAHILFGTDFAPLSIAGGTGWPIHLTVRNGEPKGLPYYARTSKEYEEDARLLRHPGGWNRRAGIIGDHGEAHPLGQGPNLYFELKVPQGAFMLSLYFLELSWPQYRDYALRVLAENGTRLASLRVDEFFNGVYKRFAVFGPTTLKLELLRGMSPNATLCALFMDRLEPPRPAPKEVAEAPVDARDVVDFALLRVQYAALCRMDVANGEQHAELVRQARELLKGLAGSGELPALWMAAECHRAQGEYEAQRQSLSALVEGLAAAYAGKPEGPDALATLGESMLARYDVWFAKQISEAALECAKSAWPQDRAAEMALRIVLNYRERSNWSGRYATYSSASREEESTEPDRWPPTFMMTKDRLYALRVYEDFLTLVLTDPTLGQPGKVERLDWVIKTHFSNGIGWQHFRWRACQRLVDQYGLLSLDQEKQRSYAGVLAATGREDEARDLLEGWLKRFPEAEERAMKSVFSALWSLNRRLGHLDRARRAFEEYARLCCARDRPDLVSMEYHLAVDAYRLDPAKGKEALRAFLKKYPDEKYWAHRAKDMLEGKLQP